MNGTVKKAQILCLNNLHDTEKSEFSLSMPSTQFMCGLVEEKENRKAEEQCCGSEHSRQRMAGPVKHITSSVLISLYGGPQPYLEVIKSASLLQYTFCIV